MNALYIRGLGIAFARAQLAAAEFNARMDRVAEVLTEAGAKDADGLVEALREIFLSPEKGSEAGQIAIVQREEKDPVQGPPQATELRAVEGGAEGPWTPVVVEGGR